MPYISFIVICLTLFWLLLSGFWDNGLLLGLGATSIALVAYLIWGIEKRFPTALFTSIILALPRFLIWLIVEVAKANMDVLKRVWLPARYPVNPTMQALPMTQQSPLGKTIYANSITLTPGTVSVDVQDDTVLVHAISSDGIADLAAGEMDRRITALEGRTA